MNNIISMIMDLVNKGRQGTIGLIDVDGKLPNLALMKISSYCKNLGLDIEFVQQDKKYDLIFASCLFTWNKHLCKKLEIKYGEKIFIGGTGYDFEEIDGNLVQTRRTVLPNEIEHCKPDYDLYTAEVLYPRIKAKGKKENRMKKAVEIANMGIGRTSIGCVRNCQFCIVVQKEGCFKQADKIENLINPKSRIITLLDNNFTADPLFFDKVAEINKRKLKVNITQGIDIRFLTEEKAQAIASMKHWRSRIHYSWDLMNAEKEVMNGIKLLSKYKAPSSQTCYILTGYNTTFEEDMYRIKKLKDLGVIPFVMKYNKRCDLAKLNHLARWINMLFYKKQSFDEYEPWVNEQQKYIYNGTMLVPKVEQLALI